MVNALIEPCLNYGVKENKNNSFGHTSFDKLPLDCFEIYINKISKYKIE